MDAGRLDSRTTRQPDDTAAAVCATGDVDGDGTAAVSDAAAMIALLVE